MLTFFDQALSVGKKVYNRTGWQKNSRFFAWPRQRRIIFLYLTAMM